MAVELNHLIFRAKNKWASARFLAGILGIEVGPEWGRFVPVRLANGVTLDFADAPDPPHQHFAFLVSEAEFDGAFARIRDAGGVFYANSHRDGRGEINHLYGGRGVYFEDPDGNMLEMITQPYGPQRMRWVDGASVEEP